MKDHSLPPVIKLENPVLASVMGACLATKRTTAEKILKGVDRDALVFEPYANPFRTYALEQDYYKFKALFEERGVSCYIINTGHFLDRKIPKEVTIDIVERIVDETADFIDFGNLEGMKTIDIEGFIPDFRDKDYVELLENSIKNRINYLESLEDFKGGRDKLPEEAAAALQALLK